MKKSLSKAVALAATLGAAASAHAVNVDQNGLGQVLLYPVYTAEEGNVTAVHVTNTTDDVKAVKVRFVEGMNSQEVLDFNLYLSPRDVWTAGVVQTESGAKLVTADKSCATVGAEQEFLTYLFDGSFAGQKDSVSTADRTRVGHLEVIEMGVVDKASALGKAAIHNAAGVPANCGLITAAWDTGGTWMTAPGTSMTRATGGLYGTATVINVEAGTEFGVEVTAINNFWDPTAAPTHSQPGDMLPNLGQAQTRATFANGASMNVFDGWDAVSAVLMKEQIMNDYAYGAGLNAQTDFVITFPTKRNYVNPVAVAPFAKAWNRTASNACEEISVKYYDREERTKQLSVTQISPRPPQAQGIQLCHEANIFSVGDSKVLGGQHVRTQLNLDSSFQTGWIDIDLTGGVRTISDTGVATKVVNGLPVIGFAATAIQNGDVGGLLSNYAGSYTHKAIATVVTP